MWSRLPRSDPGRTERFEAFYKDVRDGLLLQSFALTGDARAAERAVRDTMVVAWHHWATVSRLDRPEDHLRPAVWRRAQRWHRARRRARPADLPGEARDTLDALGRLTPVQRGVLLLTHLTAVPLDEMARELAVTRATVERELQASTAEFAAHRGVDPAAIHGVLVALTPPVDGVSWPRASILMREGTARRRAHTTLGAVAAAAALVITGSLVTDTAGARPALSTKSILDVDRSADSGPSTAAPAPPPPDPLTAEALLDSSQVGAAIPARWTEGETTTNTEGDGLVFTCQGARYADSRGIGALVRTFTGRAPGGRAVTAGQSAEASADVDAARRAFATTVAWYAGCASPRVQLLATHRVAGVGDEAVVMVLRSWAAPQATQVVGVARTGGLTTTVVETGPSTADTANARQAPATLGRTAVDVSAGLLATAVSNLCSLPDHGACAAVPAVREVSPVPVGRYPALLIEADLPPVPGVDQPWAATVAHRARENLAATRCDQTSFAGPGFSDARTRSYVVPAATELPPEFGLTETVGALPRKAAQAFAADIRTKLAACPDNDLGTDVDRITQRLSDARDITVWRVTVEVSKRRSVRYLMAALREGNGVAQLTFVPSDDVTIGTDAFVALAKRAQARLGQLATTTG